MPKTFLALLIASTALDALLAGTMLWLVLVRHEAGRMLTLPRVVAAVIVSGVFFMCKAVVLTQFDLNIFGLIHLTYLALVIVIPLLAAGLLAIEHLQRSAARPLRLTFPVRSIAAACVIGGPVAGYYATYVEPFRLQLEQVDCIVSAERAGHQPVRIGVLADLQTSEVTEYERSAIRLLMDQKPDIIVIPGDLFQGWPSQFRDQLPHMRELLSQLHAPGGVFFVLGDCDNAARVHALLDGLNNIRTLVNEIAAINVKDRTITIGGTELLMTSQARSMIRHLQNLPGTDDIRIMLSHRPDSVLELASDSRVDLVIAGHTHGGQVVVPGFGPPLTLTHVPRTIAAGGLHQHNGNHIYVSRGVGRERGQAPSVHFFCPPEITVLSVR